MWTFIHKSASPKTCYRWAKHIQFWVAAVCIVLFFYGLYGGLIMAPTDYKQGDVYRIIYLHVPAAMMSLTVYVVMIIAALFYLIWRIKVADVVAKTSVSIGAWFTVLTLITGAIWGKPTWGTWWIWDARLTSELILLFIYMGIIAIRSAIPETQLAARASGIVTIIGGVNIPIVHFSVDWWNTLHQGASLSFFRPSTIAPSMLHPLIAMILAFLFYYVWLLLLKIRNELLARENDTTWVKNMLLKENNR